MNDRIDAQTLLERLFPLHRSITGAGVRRTHDILAEIMPLDRREIASGTQVFDWTVPQEWEVREAYVIAPDGRRILDVADHPLRLVNYSIPFRGTLAREDLDEHLHSLPDRPDAIPYITSYYAPRWGFCLTQREREALPPGNYRVVVDTRLFDGFLTLSQAVLPGETEAEALFSTYTCHPAMAVDELCGMIAAQLLYRRLAAWPRRRLTYRFVFIPETIGSIAYLAHYGDHLKRNLVAGYVLSNFGRNRPFRYKRSRRGDSLADRTAEIVLQAPLKVEDFAPAGSDERQYCSPAFNLPVGSLTREETCFPEYHTSLDGLEGVSADALVETVDVLEALCRALDGNERFRNLMPHCEPQFGRRGLYPTLGATALRAESVRAIPWVWSLTDEATDLLEIARRSGFSFDTIREAADRCVEAGLIAAIEP
ncbi:MAG: DUF4910 domain-containing protein [Magnetospirillum sp. WYHS-4]